MVGSIVLIPDFSLWFRFWFWFVHIWMGSIAWHGMAWYGHDVV